MQHQPKPFVGRADHLALVQNILSHLDRNAHTTAFDPFIRIVEFHGLAGIGKTCLLDEIRRENRAQNRLFAAVDFAATSVDFPDPFVRFLHMLCDALDHATPTFGMRAALARSEAQIDLLALFRAELWSSLARRPLVIILDSTECCPAMLFDTIGRDLFGKMVEENPELDLVILAAGRSARILDSSWPVSLKKATEEIWLDPLDLTFTAKHIQNLSPEGRYREATREIYAISNGHPHSTETLVEWLNRHNIDVSHVDERRQDLAAALHDQVIKGYVLAGAETWVLDFVSTASVLRRFDVGMLHALLGDQHTINWCAQRLGDLQEPSLHLVEFGDTEPGYYVEPTLAKLLRAAHAILQPEGTTALNKDAQVIWESKMAERVSAQFTLQAIYHAVQIAAIGGADVRMAAKDTLNQLLVAYFRPIEHTQELSALQDFIARDRDLEALVGTEGMTDLKSQVRKHMQSLRPSAPFEYTHLIIDRRPPNEYSVTWYAMDQVLLPTEVVRSPRQFPSERWRSDLEAVGKAAFASYLPRRAQDFMRSRRDWAIQITTDWVDIPWELLHDGEDFLCLSRPIARKSRMLKAPAPSDEQWMNRALVVGNPTGDLPGAEAEAREVAELLEKRGMEVKLLVGPKVATAAEFAISLTNSYDLIHYAGYGQFDDSAPNLSALVFSDGPYYAEELERSLQGAPFVFLSACDAGQAQTTMSSAGYQGRFVDGLAAAALVGGASGCLGPIWEIGDSVAREFALAFYAELLDGQAIGEAVRQARLATRNLSPDFWASWILYGDPYRKLAGAADRTPIKTVVSPSIEPRLRAWRDLISLWQLRSESKDADRFLLWAQELCDFLERFGGFVFERKRIDSEQAETLGSLDLRSIRIGTGEAVFDYRAAFAKRPKWRLGLPERFPFLFVLSDFVQEENLRHFGSALGIADADPPVAYVVAQSFSDQQKEHSRQGKVLLDTQELSLLVEQDTHQLNAAFEVVTGQRVDIAILSPYQTAGPIRRRELYFGRDAELHRILNRIKERSHFLVGRRRSGKSSTLHVVKQELDAEGGPGVDCRYSGLDGCGNHDDLRERLKIDTGLDFQNDHNVNFGWAVVSTLTQYARDHNCHVVLMWDEVDRLLDYDAELNWPLFRELRAEVQRPDAHLSLLTAGARSLFRHLRDKDSPLYNFGDVITLRRLDLEASRRLVVEPMTVLSISVDEKEVHAIHDLCSGDPRLLNALCEKVIIKLDQLKKNTIEAELVTEIARDEDFVKMFLDVNYDSLPLKDRLFILHALRCDDEGRTIDERRALKSMRARKATASATLDDVMKSAEYLWSVGDVLVKRERKLHWAVENLPSMLRQHRDLELQLEREEEEWYGAKP